MWVSHFTVTACLNCLVRLRPQSFHLKRQRITAALVAVGDILLFFEPLIVTRILNSLESDKHHKYSPFSLSQESV